MPTIIPDPSLDRNANRKIIIALTCYACVVASLIGLFSHNPKAAEWIAQSAQTEFV